MNLASDPPAFYFNELSIPQGAREAQLRPMLDVMSAVLVSARAQMSTLALRNIGTLFDVPMLSDGKTIAIYAMSVGGQLRDRWRLVLQMAQKTPTLTLAITSLTDEEYSHRGRLATGLGAAAVTDSVAISFDSHADWADPWVEVLIFSIEQDKTDVSERNYHIKTRHVSKLDHLDGHQERIRESLLGEQVTAEELWEARRDLFPSLQFLERVRNDLRVFEAGTIGLRQIYERLRELDRGCREWGASQEASPSWGLNVTPEHEHRKRLCDFVDTDGVTRTFDLHVRFTPNAGRIHFRVGSRATWPQATIAYIGSKL